MSAKFILAVFALLVLSSCHTIMENSNPYDFGGGYTQTKNEKGETIHLRERPVQAYVPPPISYPIIPVDPSPVISNPYPVTSPVTSPYRSSEGSSSAGLDSSGNNSLHSFLEFASADGNTHLGVHFGGLANDILMGRIGGSFFYSGELFLGFDFSGRAYLPTNNVQPFAGMGIYLGDTKKCKQVYSNGIPVEHCEKKFLSAGYVELGLEVKNFSIFWRDYNITRAGLSVPTESVWGIGLRF